jgi:hypothetical protein
MDDQHSEPKKPRWQAFLGVLTGLMLGQCVHNWHAFHDQGLRAFRWDNLFAAAVGAVAGAWLAGQRKHESITTLGIGETTTEKLR